MQVHKLLKRGESHKNNFEDFLLAYKINDRYSVYGVFDGCSSGVDSHFASALIAKIFRAELNHLKLENFSSTNEILFKALFNSIQSIASIQKNLFLETNELLSTVVLFIADELEMCGDIILIGDGFVSVNGENQEIDQNNEPDYLSYYLDKINSHEDLEQWMKEHATLIHVPYIVDVSISTDGIFTFQKLYSINTEENAPSPVDFLIKDEIMLDNKSMLARKCNILRTKFGMVNYDDIGIIRIINKKIRNGTI